MLLMFLARYGGVSEKKAVVDFLLDEIADHPVVFAAGIGLVIWIWVWAEKAKARSEERER